MKIAIDDGRHLPVRLRRGERLVRPAHPRDARIRLPLVALVATAAEPAVWELPATSSSLSTCRSGARPGRRGRPRDGERRAASRSVAAPPHRAACSTPRPGAREPLRRCAARTVRVCASAGTSAPAWPATRRSGCSARPGQTGGRTRAMPCRPCTTRSPRMQLLDHSLRPLCLPAGPGRPRARGGQRAGVLPALAAKWRYGTPVMLTEHGVYLREQYLQHRTEPYRWPVKALHLSVHAAPCALGYQEATTITPGNVYNSRWEERLGADPARIRTVYNGVDPANFPAVDGEPEARRSRGSAGSTRSRTWRRCCAPSPSCAADARREAAHVRLAAARAGSPTCSAARRWPPNSASTRPPRSRAGSTDIRDAYEAGSIVALSSVSEGFPYSLIEAMTCGRACVATDVGGVTEAVGDTGLVVPPRSPEPMAEACLTLLQDDDLRHRLGAAARAARWSTSPLTTAINTFDEIYQLPRPPASPMPTAPLQLLAALPTPER